MVRVPNSVYGAMLSVGVATIFFATTAAASPSVSDGGKVGELQIDVVSKPSSCFIKSQKGDQLSMHYDGALSDGTPFDSSRKRNQPFVFKRQSFVPLSLGTGQVIKGWDQGLMDMCPGEHRKLTIPAHMGYGDRGAGGVIPGGATLVFDVELLEIKNRKPGKEELK
ncbi:Peptidyl-prolyl cis-trans isomerase, FKBP-type [Pseudohyphozyma bogoriensis]|nr:Peptidyl-prolyl cis-trans isomerase, FKBP-type [Pseudohyphozyma bogoriensis]